MTRGLIYLFASTAGTAIALRSIARAGRSGDEISPVLGCDHCPALVTTDTAHRPHEPGCPGEGCCCDRLTCAACCDELACVDPATFEQRLRAELLAATERDGDAA